MWLAAWKLVSNDAKRTVAPPNAKHSTLLQGCFFRFLFLIPFTIRQQCIIYTQKFPTEPLEVRVLRRFQSQGEGIKKSSSVVVLEDF